MKKIRNRKITVRYSDEELEQAKKKSVGTMASWLRDLSLDQKDKKLPKPVNPKLLYELNAIGVNLNQIARRINSDRELTAQERIDLIFIFESIEEELKQLRVKYDS